MSLAFKANKQTGISQPKDFERFCKFAVVAYDQNIDLPEESLRAYLQRNGWSHEHADAAAKRYIAAIFLLRVYDKFKSGQLSL